MFLSPAGGVSSIDLEATISNQIHGVPIGRGSFDVICDLPHEVPEAVDCSRRVQYECIRIGESMTLLQGVPLVGVWTPDLLRCADCEIESLRDPTDGYGEGLVELDIGWQGDQRVLDASELTLLDYSPVDDGEDPPLIPKPVVDIMIEHQDWGALRRSRLAERADQFRRWDADELAASIEAQL